MSNVKVVVITRYRSYEMVMFFLKRRYQVVLGYGVDDEKDRLAALFATHHEYLNLFRLDPTSRQGVHLFVEEIIDKCDYIDILINSHAEFDAVTHTSCMNSHLSYNCASVVRMIHLLEPLMLNPNKDDSMVINFVPRLSTCRGTVVDFDFLQSHNSQHGLNMEETYFFSNNIKSFLMSALLLQIISVRINHYYQKRSKKYRVLLLNHSLQDIMMGAHTYELGLILKLDQHFTKYQSCKMIDIVDVIESGRPHLNCLLAMSTKERVRLPLHDCIHDVSKCCDTAKVLFEVMDLPSTLWAS